MNATIPNPDLAVGAGNKAYWTQADNRRWGWHNFHRIARYTTSLRAARVLVLEERPEPGIASAQAVRHLTSLKWFSAMVVLKGRNILYERYAPDFGPDQPHSLQSITKTMMNLIVGPLVERGQLDLNQTVGHYIPEIGSGYANAKIQQVLDMNVVNDYSEDFADPKATYYRHEEAMGLRLPPDPLREETEQRFLAKLTSSDTTNHSGHLQYKDANTDVLGWVVERATRISARMFLADIVDAAGLEDALYITTDRVGFPFLAGGACMSARDLARYFSLFVRLIHGPGDQCIGSKAFVERSLASGVVLPPPYRNIRYRNHLLVSGDWVGHSGWGGQFAMANLRTGVVGVFFSVLEDEHAVDRGYTCSIIDMLQAISETA